WGNWGLATDLCFRILRQGEGRCPQDFAGENLGTQGVGTLKPGYRKAYVITGAVHSYVALLHSTFQEFAARSVCSIWSRAMSEFRPFVLPEENRPEFTVRAVLLGAIFGLIFGGVTVYVGLRAGLTVAASIPIAVISVSLLRYKGKPSVLEVIVTQTCGNAG